MCVNGQNYLNRTNKPWDEMWLERSILLWSQLCQNWAKLVKTAQVWGKTIQHQNLLWLDLARKSQENDLKMHKVFFTKDLEKNFSSNVIK